MKVSVIKLLRHPSYESASPMNRAEIIFYAQV